MKSFADILDILYEDNHLLALNKPCGWPTTHYDGKEETVDRLVKSYIKEKYNKPGNVYLGVVHRLDKPTSGTLLFAKTSKAASRLSEQFRSGAVEKVYWAVAEQLKPIDVETPEQAYAGTMIDWICHDEVKRMVKIVDKDYPDAKVVRLDWQIRRRHNNLTLFELRPHTGRKHQLRVQLSSRQLPIYGDKKYGSAYQFGHGIALHARSLSVIHPTTAEPIQLTAELPASWKRRFAHLIHGG